MHQHSLLEGCHCISPWTNLLCIACERAPYRKTLSSFSVSYLWSPRPRWQFWASASITQSLTAGLGSLLQQAHCCPAGHMAPPGLPLRRWSSSIPRTEGSPAAEVPNTAGPCRVLTHSQGCGTQTQPQHLHGQQGGIKARLTEKSETGFQNQRWDCSGSTQG